MSNIFKSSIALAVSVALTACGGSDSSDSTPKEPANVAPQLANIDAQSIKEGKSITITVSAIDSDGSISSYAWSQTDGNSVELSNVDTATVSFSAPALDEDASITLKVTTTDDDGATASTNATVNLLNNRLPTIESISAQSFNENGEFNIDAVIADEDGEIASIRWEQVSGKVITFADSDKSSVSINTPKIDQDEVGQLRIIATDDDGEETQQFIDFDLINTHHNITLSGNTSVSGAALINSEVTFDINNQTFETVADANGDYSIDLDVELGNENYAYQLNASGVDEQSNIELSRTALFSEVLLSSEETSTEVKSKLRTSTKKPQDKKISHGRDARSIDMNYLTTAESEYLASLFDDENFTNTEYVDSSKFKSKYNNIDAQLLLEIATLFSYVSKNKEGSVTKDGWISNVEYLASLYDDEEITVLFDELLRVQKDKNKNETLKFLDTNTTYYGTLAATKGTIRKGVGFQQSFVFGADGQYLNTNQTEIKSAQWVVADSKVVVDTSAWSSTADTKWSDTVSAWVDCTYAPVQKQFDIISSWQKGSKKVIINTIENVVCSDNGTEVENYVGNYDTHLTLFNLDDLEAWQAKDLENKSIVFEHYSDTAKSELKNLDSETRSMEYQFNTDGTGVVVEDNNASFTWSIDDEGQLQMTFGDYTISWLKMDDDLEDNAAGASVFAIYIKGDNFHQYQDMAVTVDTPTWQETDFIGKWDHGFSVSQPKYNAFVSGFFFELNEDGTASKNNTSVDGTIIERTREVRWYVEDNKVVIARTYTWDENGWGGWTNCDYKSEANCYFAEHRKWEVIAERNVKGQSRYYVKETLGFDNDLWERGTPSTDLADFYMTERTNFYQPFNK